MCSAASPFLTGLPDCSFCMSHEHQISMRPHVHMSTICETQPSSHAFPHLDHLSLDSIAKALKGNSCLCLGLAWGFLRSHGVGLSPLTVGPTTQMNPQLARQQTQTVAIRAARSPFEGTGGERQRNTSIAFSALLSRLLDRKMTQMRS